MEETTELADDEEEIVEEIVEETWEIRFAIALTTKSRVGDTIKPNRLRGQTKKNAAGTENNRMVRIGGTTLDPMTKKSLRFRKAINAATGIIPTV